MCKTCHQFLFSGDRKRRLQPLHNMPKRKCYSLNRGHTARYLDNDNNNHKQLFSSKIADQSNGSAYDSNTSNTHISVLPVEMLQKIFSFLKDDITLLEASNVNKQWRGILSTEDDLWKKFTNKRWPLFRNKTKSTNWYKVRLSLT